jgi:hypothetical protein
MRSTPALLAGLALILAVVSAITPVPLWVPIALLAVAMCEHPEVQDVFDANLAVALDADHYGAEGEDDNRTNGLAEVAAAYATMSQRGIDMAVAYLLWISTEGFVPWNTIGKTATEPLAADGDYDNDGFTNLDEYEFVSGNGGTPEDYAIAASGGEGGPELQVPVASILGLGLLAGACLIGGARALSRKR